MAKTPTWKELYKQGMSKSSAKEHAARLKYGTSITGGIARPGVIAKARARQYPDTGRSNPITNVQRNMMKEYDTRRSEIDAAAKRAASRLNKSFYPIPDQKVELRPGTVTDISRVDGKLVASRAKPGTLKSRVTVTGLERGTVGIELPGGERQVVSAEQLRAQRGTPERLAAAARLKADRASKKSTPPLKAGESFNPRTGEITRDKPNMPGDRLSKSGRTVVDKDGELVRKVRPTYVGNARAKDIGTKEGFLRRNPEFARFGGGGGGGGKSQPRVPAGNPKGGQWTKK